MPKRNPGALKRSSKTTRVRAGGRSRRLPPVPRRNARRGGFQRRTYRSSGAAPLANVKRSRRRHLPKLPRPSAARVGGGVLLAGLVGVLVLLFASDLFYVQTAEINGLRFSRKSEVYRAANVHGASVFWVDGQEAAQSIERLPYVRSATVHPLLPDKVRIDVVEREPVAVWRVAGQDVWVDSEGVAMPVASPLNTMPVLEDRDGSSLGEAKRVDPDLVYNVLTLHRRLPEAGSLAYDKLHGLNFGLPDGAVVYLGWPEDVERQLQELSALQATLASQGALAREIDLRYEGGYYYR